jgi:hypothetical protein
VWLLLVMAGAVGAAYLVPPAKSTEAGGSLAAQCEAWDAAASAELAKLIAVRSEAVEARLADAVFRLRRARKNCRHQWLNLARLDYVSIVDGRYRDHR